MRLSVSLVSLLTVLSYTAGAQELRLESGGQRVQVVELYTSEGCNSCPPAEAFLNGYAKDPQLWKRIIPMAFHVDYWDYLGWRDRYASPANSRRQHDYARWLRMNTVYTPALFLNGTPWRNWRWGRLPETGNEVAGKLSASLDGGRLQVDYRAAVNDPAVELHVAVLGMGLVSKIRAGENRGRTSRHDFVVLWHRTVADGGRSWQLKLPAPEFGARRYALAVWVSRPGIPAPVQAVAGYLP